MLVLLELRSGIHECVLLLSTQPQTEWEAVVLRICAVGVSLAGMLPLGTWEAASAPLRRTLLGQSFDQNESSPQKHEIRALSLGDWQESMSSKFALDPLKIQVRYKGMGQPSSQRIPAHHGFTNCIPEATTAVMSSDIWPSVAICHRCRAMPGSVCMRVRSLLKGITCSPT